MYIYIYTHLCIYSVITFAAVLRRFAQTVIYPLQICRVAETTWNDIISKSYNTIYHTIILLNITHHHILVYHTRKMNPRITSILLCEML